MACMADNNKCKNPHKHLLNDADGGDDDNDNDDDDDDDGDRDGDN